MTLEDMIRERGLKKEWIADQIGVPPGQLSHMLRGKRVIPADKVPALAKALRYPEARVRLAVAGLMKERVPCQ